MFKVKEYLVYKYEGGRQEVFLPENINVSYANFETISYFFKNDKLRLTTFNSFLRKGYIGIILNDGKNWVNYGWMTNRIGQFPPHLPKRICSNNKYWLFYSHTKEEWRGKGIYKNSLKLLINKAYEIENGDVEVYADVEKTNLVPQNTLLSLGFKEYGNLYNLCIGFPKIGSANLGYWKSKGSV